VFLAHRSVHRSEDETAFQFGEDMAEKVVKDIRRATRKQYSAEEKIRIVLEGLRGEDSIAELCRREGIAQRGLRPLMYCSPVLRHSAELIQAANFRSAVVF
jgi:hypothetical protein